MRSILRYKLIAMACILLWNSAVRVHDSEIHDAEILVLCDRRRELRKKRFESEGSEKYREVNNNFKLSIYKAYTERPGTQSS